MSFIDRIRRQQAVYWKAGGLRRDGKTSFEAPEQVDCRWTDKSETMEDENGITFVSRSFVYLGFNAKRGDALMLGELESGMTSEPPLGSGAFLIKTFQVTPDIKARAYLRKAVL